MIHNSKIPIVFFGSSKYVLPILDILIKDFDLKLVVTTEQKPSDAVPQFAINHDTPMLQTTNLGTDEMESILRNVDAKVAVLASFGLLVPQEIIDIFPKGIVNIHPSFLPEYRGPTPIQQAILDGKTETAVSLMLLDSELDHGPLLAQISLAINATDTAESLYNKAFTLGAEKLVDVLPAFLAGNLEPREQDHSKATYTPREITRQTGFIDLKNPPSKEQIERMIRAYYPWPGVWTKVRINNQEKILKLLPNLNVIARSETTKQPLPDKILFQVEGKKPVTRKDLLNGYPELIEIIEKSS